MRLLAFILALILFCVSMVPCDDGADSCGAESLIVQTGQSGDGHDHNSNEDRCSPLCSCQCCHVQASCSLVEISFIVTVPPRPQSFYSNLFTIPVPDPIWQPPIVG